MSTLAKVRDREASSAVHQDGQARTASPSFSEKSVFHSRLPLDKTMEMVRLRFSLNNVLADIEVEVSPVNYETLLPLEYLRTGEWAEVAEVSGEPNWVCRMAEMGVRAGCRLLCVQSGSPCLLQVGGCRLSLRGDPMAQVMVRPLGLVS